MKHLFIEGPIQTGKSTLLRICLEPYRERLGGFSSQRLMSEGNIAAAYRITKATDFCLQQEPDFSLPGIFQKRTENGSEKHPEIFENYGVRLLEESKGKELILLDEIGGSELLVPSFHDKLYEVLSGDTPCIGIIKLNEKAKFMSKIAGYPAIVAKLNEQLRYDLIEKFDAQIISFDANKKDIAEQTIKEFLCGVFTTI